MTSLAAVVQRWVPDWLRRQAQRGLDQLDDVVGGRARRQVIVVLACVLALDAADKGALSATAGQIQHYFDISKTQFGILGSITTGVSAVATLPFGRYVDRVTRTRLLAWTVVVWGIAMLVSAAATSYLFLLLARIFLGVVTAVAYPTVASLIGDYFPTGERSRVYGLVLSGELIGTGIGVALSGGAASAFGSWRAAMIVLAPLAAAVTWLLVRLPEPARGGSSRMPVGQEKILSAERVEAGDGPDRSDQASADDSSDENLARGQAEQRGVDPDPALVLRSDPLKMSLWAAVRYTLRVRTNLIVIIASALGYFFFSGLRFFAIQYVQHHYGISRGVASVLILVVGVGAVAGVVTGGRLADWLLRRGRLNARIVVPAVGFAASAIVFAPAIATTTLALAVGLYVIAAFLLGAVNPPLDASRLDVMHPRLWGREEAVRSVFRGALEAAAPVTFGLVADNVFGGRGHGGLELTFLVMLIPVLACGLILLVAMRTYPRDVATAAASIDALNDDPEAYPGEKPRQQTDADSPPASSSDGAPK